MKKIIAILLFATVMLGASAQTISPEEYVATYKDFAIREMKRMGVPAAITLAQGLLETENGNSVLVKKSNNHFGIKCKSTWTGPSTSHDDDAPGECFRVYETAEESYRDHSNFLRGSDRYAFLFRLSPLDYKGWAYGLKKAGYATNIKYSEILIKNIEKYNLQQYSLIGVDSLPPTPPVETKEDVSKTEATATSETTSNTNTKIIYYQVQPKEGLYSIAKKHGVLVSQLREWNKLENDSLKIGQQLIVYQQQ